MRRGLKETYDSIYRDRADPWDYWSSEYESRKYREQISLVAQFGTPRHVLEIGCSTGAHTKLIHDAFPDAEITAVDISSTAIARAAKNLNEAKSVSFHTADIFSFVETLAPHSMDLVIWSETFDFLHEHCTFGEFSRLVQRLNMCLVRGGILCVSHIVPGPLSYAPIEAGQKNVRVFHDLIRDYFHQLVSANSTLHKSESDKSYRHEVRLYRPRLLQITSGKNEEIRIDLVDVVIPARDEAQTITEVITSIRRSRRVDRVIVVDNGSVDGTGELALAVGASVVRCPERGYGRSVKWGVEESSRRWLLKLDADVENARTEWVDLLIDCATREKSRLAKTYWTASIEDPDRVTNFTAKPAFRIFFPELSFLHSPLSGIYLFDKFSFDFRQLPNGFSFDVAMLISALKDSHNISQIEIETVRHATIANGKRTFQHYYNMSDEVLSYIVEAGLARFQ